MDLLAEPFRRALRSARPGDRGAPAALPLLLGRRGPRVSGANSPAVLTREEGARRDLHPRGLRGRGRAAASRLTAQIPLDPALSNPAEGGSSAALGLTPWGGGAVLGAGAVVIRLLVSVRRHGDSGGVAAPRAVETSRGEGRALTTRDIARKTLLSAASLTCARSGGAGFFVTPELLLTNEHVLCREGEALTVRLRDGRALPGRVLQRDDWKDLALVSVPGAAATRFRGRRHRGRGRRRVLAIGNPRGLEFSLTEGS